MREQPSCDSVSLVDKASWANVRQQEYNLSSKVSGNQTGGEWSREAQLAHAETGTGTHKGADC